MDDLVAFLAARLAEAWATARNRELAAGLDESVETRMVSAMRAILAQWEHSPAGSPVLTNTLYQLAAIWSDHPGYRPEWKP